MTSCLISKVIIQATVEPKPPAGPLEVKHSVVIYTLAESGVVFLADIEILIILIVLSVPIVIRLY